RSRSGSNGDRDSRSGSGVPEAALASSRDPDSVVRRLRDDAASDEGPALLDPLRRGGVRALRPVGETIYGFGAANRMTFRGLALQGAVEVASMDPSGREREDGQRRRHLEVTAILAGPCRKETRSTGWRAGTTGTSPDGASGSARRRGDSRRK